jgi:palmitoyl transferase
MNAAFSSLASYFIPSVNSPTRMGYPFHEIPRRCFLACVFVMLALLGVRPAGAETGDEASLWQKAKSKAALIYGTGKQEIYIAGYTHHGRNTYTPERIAELNEWTWGGGWGKSIRNANGDDESLYAMIISDSHYKPQPMVGYAYQWMWPVGHSGIEIGAGGTVMLISRADYFGGFPFPIALPIGSVGTRRVKLLASYVPRLSKKEGNGDVLFMFMRFEMD